MEVRIEAIEGRAVPKDCFVAMRIGDVQKQSRFSSSHGARTYRFPDPGEDRAGFGRIEVFQRVGHMTVFFHDLGGKLQDVEVPVDLAGQKSLSMKLAAKGNVEEEKPQGKKQRAKTRLDSAQRYIAEHRLEEILADAMREVIHEKPADPFSLLSKLVMKHAPTKEEPVIAAENGTLSDVQATPKPESRKEDLRKKTAEMLVSAANDGGLEEALHAVRGSVKDTAVVNAKNRATESLIAAASNGSLKAVLQQVTSKPTEAKNVEVIRSKVASSLLAAATDGTLPQILATEIKQTPNLEDLRLQAREALLQSAKSGSLAEALKVTTGKDTTVVNANNRATDRLIAAASTDSPKAVLQQVTSKPTEAKNVEVIRSKVASSLLAAATDGTLAQILGTEIKQTPDLEDLRLQAREALLQSAKSGSLAEALKATTVTCGVEATRERIKGVLLTSARDGRLEAAVVEVEEETDLENLRSEARNALVSSAKSGQLHAALQAGRGKSPTEPDVEKLRLEARQALRISARNGTLRSALSEASKELSKTESHKAVMPDIEKLRLEARSALMGAAVNGTLEMALKDSLTSQAPCKVPFKFTPSVATWYQKKPPAVPRPWYYRKFQCEPADEKVISELQGVISQKDNEIEELKTTLRLLGHPVPTSIVTDASELPPTLKRTSPEETLKSMSPPAATQEALAIAKPQPSPVLPFRDYYCTHFKMMSSTANSKLYAKFGVPAQAATSQASVPLPFRDYYCTHFKTASSTANSKLYAKFSVPAQAATSQSSVPGVEQTVRAQKPFNMLPSVGTWLCLRPKTEDMPRRPEQTSCAQKPFKTLPSVGTWLCLRPKTDDMPNRPKSVSILSKSHEAMKTMPAEDLITAFEKEIKKRDEEIEQLKATLKK
eukprot:TRINITY_DN3205_c0_g1_i2.p1 TRINITY_DN3205_c0_g1~~TRINITY_DN3205_c0_g1_i2.p1  ORF type:complete len:906 (+),score=197.75 TRINITY_DN3205_c0_g1_i2:49-2718(+)